MKMPRAYLLILTGILLSLMTACGGGGGGGSQDTVISGVAQAGVFRGATVKFYGYDAAGNRLTLTTDPVSVGTDNNGEYRAVLKSYSGPVLVRVFGTYRDEASGIDVTIPEASALQAAVADAAGAASVQVTPLTDLAVRKALEAGSLKENISAANQAVSALFGVDIINTAPVAPAADILQDAAVSEAAKKYTIALLVLSQYAVNASSTPAAPGPDDLQASLSEIGSGISVSAGVAEITSTQVAFNLQKASEELSSNSNTKPLVSAGGGTAANALASIAAAGSPPGSKVMAVRIQASGSYSGSLGGIQARLTLPDGVTVRSDAVSGAVLPGVVVASGNAAGALVTGKVSTGAVVLALASSGFSLGEFATVYCDVPGTSTLTAAEIAVSNLKSTDPNGVAVDGIVLTAF